MGGWTLQMVKQHACTKVIYGLWEDSSPRPKSKGIGKSSKGGGGGCQVDMALFTGCIVNSIMSTDLFLLVVI